MDLIYRIIMDIQHSRIAFLLFLHILLMVATVSSRKIPAQDTEGITINLGQKRIFRENVPLYARVVLKCTFNSPIWFKNASPLETTTKQTKIIKFERIRKANAGVYACHSTEGGEWSNLTLVVDNRLRSIPEDDTHFTGNLEIQSQVSENVALTDDVDTDDYFEEQFRTVRNDLKEENVDLSTRTPDGDTVDPSSVHVAPYFTKASTLSRLLARPSGNMVKLKCIASGNPEPNITWTKDGKSIERKFGHVNYGKRAITLEDLVLEDAGNYTCHVCNDLGCVNHTTELIVQDRTMGNDLRGLEIHNQVSNNVITANKKGILDPGTNEIADSSQENLNQQMVQNKSQGYRAPVFTRKGSMHFLESHPTGHSITLKCASSGNPQPTITWSKNNSNGTINRQLGGIRYSKTGISMDSLTPSDSGNYTCNVCNIVACINFTYQLMVMDRFPSRPYIMTPPLNQTAVVKRNITFSCESISDLEAHTEWYKFRSKEINGTDLPEHTKLKTDPNDPGILRLENVTYSDEGWYTCLTANTLGATTASAYLHVVDEDSPLVAPIKNYSIYTICVIAFSVLLLLSSILIVCTYKKLNREKLIMKHRMQTVHQWNKKVIVIKPAPDASNPEAVIVPIIKIEKQRTTQMQSANNDPQPISEYEFPMDSNWEFPRNYLVLGKTLGEGAFGRVVMAEANGLVKNGFASVVAVKMVKEGHTDSDMASLVHEMEVMKMIGKHINIINLLGCCSQGGPLYVIVEYAPHGNLKDFLKKNRPRSEFDIPFIAKTEEEEYDPDKKNLTQKHLISFAFQIARGMEYLASRRCIHRDLAARNVLVSDDYVMKIADFGLARDIQDTDYYRKATNGRLPIKWMAPESLTDKFYDTKSDVWSYGILLWEIMSFGEQPYPSIYSADDLNIFLRCDHRLEKPKRCSNNIYMLMRQCWQFNPQDRPNFSQLVVDLDKILSATANDEYLDLGVPLLETPPSSDDEESDTEAHRELLHSNY
ncbi:fibroblast growth factor receptor homolog 1-like isoform X1 [Lutzomyia longipalpis]|uniref:fibroblast growth factor receptor homolog 1-like isoform X1 n=1 Tax=Lutzomyia longipalpis TaxID=7200 RepID=UPI0024835576|nr:fibroblast growth factor receptor homolog 1-like isoform X1 [Lutzomyia longipalpis]XP_055678062.1 fibroblast growth factor receptor homolog 1-like isoform X1 [Lutzomyia longipalpis]